MYVCINTRESLGELEKAVETLACGSLACVASVSVEQRAKKKRGFRRFARAKNGARAKKRRWGRGGKVALCSTETLATQASGSCSHSISRSPKLPLVFV